MSDWQGYCKQLQKYVRIEDFCRSYGTIPRNKKSLRNLMRKQCPYDPMIWNVMRRNAWKDISNWQIKKTQHWNKVATPCMDDHLFQEKENESVGELSTVCSQIVLKCLHFARVGRRDIFVVCKQTCSCGHELDKSLWQTFGAFDLLHYHTSEYRQYCYLEKHSTTMQIKIVFKILILQETLKTQNQHQGSLVYVSEVKHFVSISWIVQETNLSFTQFYRSWSNLSLCRFTHGWDSPRSICGIWCLKYVQWKHAKTNSNHAHQSRSDQHKSRSIKWNTFLFQCHVICPWGQWSRY